MKPKNCDKCGNEIGGGICITIMCEDGKKFYFCTSLCGADWLTPFKDLGSGEIRKRRKKSSLGGIHAEGSDAVREMRKKNEVS